jgi:hypothetical protein
MLNRKRLLVPIDGSDNSLHALVFVIKRVTEEQGGISKIPQGIGKTSCQRGVFRPNRRGGGDHRQLRKTY